MKAVVQRVTNARVLVGGEVVGAIGPGALVLLGIERGDTEAAIDALAERLAHLRMYADATGRTNLSALDVRAAVLVVSQFTLCADLRRGRRPSFDSAEEPERARELVERFVAALRGLGLETATGRFGASMEVELVNSGPVTFLL